MYSTHSFHEDHPRIRGKDFWKMTAANWNKGSPPHTRERPYNALEDLESYRITPAYAGKTPATTYPTRQSQDHPRIRGKDCGSATFFFSVSGSPPHTRERPLHKPWLKRNQRITPAYAGKTVTIPNNINTFILEFKMFYSLYISVLLIAYFLYLRAL